MVRPIADIATPKRRHYGILASFVALVALPVLASVLYLWMFAQDQYASTVGFTVRQEDSAGASGILGGLARFAGASTSADGDILYAFIQSQEIVETIDQRIDLRGHYAQNWPRDPVFALWPNASIEDLHGLWLRKITVSFDRASGLTELRVLANDPDYARLVATEIVAESQKMINSLNSAARRDLMSYAIGDLETAQERVRSAREALTAYRVKTQIVDPQADIQGRMGVLNNLQQQLAQSMIEYDLLLQTTQPTDPRLRESLRRLEVIQTRIAGERSNQSRAPSLEDTAGLDYPSLIAEFERMAVDLEFAEQSYRAALAALDIARSEATRQSRYLSPYISPTQPEVSEYPERLTLTALIALFLVMVWSVGMLVYYSIRDRR